MFSSDPLGGEFTALARAARPQLLCTKGKEKSIVVPQNFILLLLMR